MITALVVLWLAITCAVVSASAAAARERSSLAWFATGLLLGPIGLAVLALPLPLRCPTCAEPIRKDAHKCPYCGVDLPPGAAREDRGLPLPLLLSAVIVGLIVAGLVAGVWVSDLLPE